MIKTRENFPLTNGREAAACSPTLFNSYSTLMKYLCYMYSLQLLTSSLDQVVITLLLYANDLRAHWHRSYRVLSSAQWSEGGCSRLYYCTQFNIPNKVDYSAIGTLAQLSLTK